MQKSKIDNVQLEQKLNSEQMTKCVQSPPANAKPNVARSFCLSFPIKILTHNIDISKLNSQKFIDFYAK